MRSAGWGGAEAAGIGPAIVAGRRAAAQQDDAAPRAGACVRRPGASIGRCTSPSRSSTRSSATFAGNAQRILAVAARRRARRGATSSSRPSSRCAAIRRRTCCCGRRSSTRTCASSPRSPPRSATRTLTVGFPDRHEGRCHNAVAVIARRRVTHVYRKQCLPNYTVFDEERYFEPGHAPCVFDVDGVRVGLVICEDIWFPGPAAQARAAGAQVLVVPNGSPYHTRQQALRRETRRRARAGDRPADRLREPRRRAGRAGLRRRVVRRRRERATSCSRCPPGTRRWRSCAFDGAAPKPVRGALDPRLESHVYHALVMGVRDYVDEEPLSRRAARALRRHRFGADAGRRRRRARTRPGARA